jgi:hypothetical protein
MALIFFLLLTTASNDPAICLVEAARGQVGANSTGGAVARSNAAPQTNCCIHNRFGMFPINSEMQVNGCGRTYTLTFSEAIA